RGLEGLEIYEVRGRDPRVWVLVEFRVVEPADGSPLVLQLGDGPFLRAAGGNGGAVLVQAQDCRHPVDRPAVHVQRGRGDLADAGCVHGAADIGVVPELEEQTVGAPASFLVRGEERTDVELDAEGEAAERTSAVEELDG